MTALAALIFFYFVLQRFWPAPFGVLVQGLIIGGLTALIAFGLALVYRSNRIINFAQGDLGGVPASLGVLLILGPGVPYLLAFPIAIAAGIALGALVEFVFIRRFFKAPRLILTVVTIGVSQLLAGIATVLPRVFGLERPATDFPTPFDFNFNIGKVVIQGNEVVAMIIVPIVIVALVAFFRFTDIGVAVRASAENSDRAALLGVPVKRLQTIVWIVATVLATVAIFLRAGIVGLPIGSVLGPTILVARARGRCHRAHGTTADHPRRLARTRRHRSLRRLQLGERAPSGPNPVPRGARSAAAAAPRRGESRRRRRHLLVAGGAGSTAYSPRTALAA